MAKLDVMRFLKNNVRPVTGCTEPVAIGYAAALAYHALYGILPVNNNGVMTFSGSCPAPQNEYLHKITIKTDRNVYKNALAVAIPGTGGKKGIGLASAMGMYCNPADRLNLFEKIGKDIVSFGNEIAGSGKVIIENVDDNSDQADLDIRVSLDYIIDGNTKTASVRLQHYHSNIVQIIVEGNVVYDNKSKAHSELRQELPDTIAELVDIAKGLTSDEKDEIYKGIVMNKAIAEGGLNSDYGLGLGKTFESMVKDGVLNDSIITQVRIKSAAAGDARMGGANIPVMSTAGSGNQGITALVPIVIVGEKYDIEKGKLCEAAMLSHLVTRYAENLSGHLSALCGCAIKAGIGAAAGLTYMLGGNIEQINNAINIVAANITGMVCDGAKEGCALKLSTAAGAAAESAFMALKGINVPTDNGIVCKKAEDTIKAIGKISHSMVQTDHAVIDIMQGK